MASAPSFLRLQHRFKRRRFWGSGKAHLRLLPLAAVLLLALPGALADEGPGANPALTGGYYTSSSTSGVAVAGGYAYVVDGNIGLVVGATYPEQMQTVRQLCPDMVILAPGVGAQGGDLENTVKYGVNARGEGLILNASRSVIFASRDRADFAREARRAAQELRQNINRARE